MPDRKAAERIAALFRAQLARGERNVAAIARAVKKSRTQVYRYLRAAKLIAPAKRRVQGKAK